MISAVNSRTETRTGSLRQTFENAQDREFRLWSIVVLLGSFAAAGLAALAMSNLIGIRELTAGHARQLSVLLLGFVALFTLFDLHVFKQRRLLQRARDEVVNQMALREAAEQEALLDPLTGAYNRRYLEHVLVREAHRADRLNGSMTLIMVDIDDFRLVNNRFGHIEGDRLLRDVTQVLIGTFRCSDTVIRYGGDEFLVLLPEASEASAHQALDRLDRAVTQWNQNRSGGGYEMKLSCGLASYSRGADVLAVLASADRRMYARKKRPRGVGLACTGSLTL